MEAAPREVVLGGKINACENCVDRHVREGRGNKAAIVWEGEPGDRRVLTYRELLREVRQFATVLRGLGVGKGDRVGIYLPMVPEAAVAMLACARIGAAHSVVFGGFSADSLRDRMNDAGAKVLVTADAGWRRGALVPLKANVDQALEGAPTVEHVVVLRRTGTEIHVKEGRDHWWHRLMQDAKPDGECEGFDAEQVLFLLYTSGTTGKPKGIVHTTGGYMTGVSSTARMVFDLRDDDVFWCTADVGWITGHSYVVYGPLSLGATVLMYEGAPDWPDRGRFWEIAERHGATIFYTAPTAIRAFMKWGAEWPAKRDLSALRLLGSVGEPINPEAWSWYREHIGGGRLPVVDTWWQTETGAILVSPLPGLTTTRPGSATFALPGIEMEVVDEAGNRVEEGGGYLVSRKPWPSMLRTIWGDDERYRKTYFGRWGDGVYVTGDGARLDKDGYLWLLGRVDDVLNVAGHRIGTAEVESALVEHPAVAEAAVVGRPDAMKGQAIVAFVSLRVSFKSDPQAIPQELREWVAKKIGAIARPDDVHVAVDLPKTRSGKIMRRLLRDIAEGRALGDRRPPPPPPRRGSTGDGYDRGRVRSGTVPASERSEGAGTVPGSGREEVLMKQLVLVAMLAALASSALTLLGVHAMAPGGVEGPRPGPPSGGQVDLSEVVKELAALRRELGEALRTAVPQAQPATAPSGGTSGPGGRVIAVPYEGRGLAPAEAVPSTTRYTRMAETLEPDHETEGRQQVGKGPRARWMVRSEREVVDWFGPPDKVQVYEDGSEYWTFRTPKDSGIEGKDGLTFHIHEGRVIDVY